MKKYEIPALLSLFVPGFGQMVKNHFGKMIAIFLLLILIVLNYKLELVIKRNEHFLAINILFYYILTAFSVYDAYNSNNDFKDKFYDS
jgi:hypothetical protein